MPWVSARVWLRNKKRRNDPARGRNSAETATHSRRIRRSTILVKARNPVSSPALLSPRLLSSISSPLYVPACLAQIWIHNAIRLCAAVHTALSSRLITLLHPQYRISTFVRRSRAASQFRSFSPIHIAGVNSRKAEATLTAASLAARKIALLDFVCRSDTGTNGRHLERIASRLRLGGSRKSAIHGDRDNGKLGRGEFIKEHLPHAGRDASAMTRGGIVRRHEEGERERESVSDRFSSGPRDTECLLSWKFFNKVSEDVTSARDTAVSRASPRITLELLASCAAPWNASPGGEWRPRSLRPLSRRRDVDDVDLQRGN